MISVFLPEDTDCDILKLMDVLLSNDIEVKEKQQVLKNKFGIPMTQELERGLNDMCNLGVAIEREGVTKGMLLSIKNLMETTHWSAERAMAALKVPENERQQSAELLLTKQ